MLEKNNGKKIIMKLLEFGWIHSWISKFSYVIVKNLVAYLTWMIVLSDLIHVPKMIPKKRVLLKLK